MRMTRVRWFRAALAVLAAVPLAVAQDTGGGAPAGGGQTPSTPTVGGGNTGGRGGNTTTVTPTTPSPTRTPQTPPRPLFVTGNVTLPDGSVPADRVMIERICSTNNVRVEGYTDSRGRFSFQIGANLTQLGDASTQVFLDPNGTGGLSLFDPNPALANSPNPATELVFWDCELRGKLPGYISTSLPLAGKRFLDNPNIGTIILTPMAKTEGLTVSATSAAAPKDARKALEKGVEEARKEKWDRAEKELRKAVELHPAYAEAWLELGRLLERRMRDAEAREAYQKAIAADGKYVYPYVELYELAFREEKLQEVADLTDTVLRLNPYEFPMAYYLNGVANLQLKNLEAAERSARKAIEADTRGRNPKTHYLLGMVLVQTHDYAGARTSFQNFVQAAPNDAQRPTAENIIAQIDKALGTAPAAAAQQ
jgi:tetratricopeptide (TPR) repeat protein